VLATSCASGIYALKRAAPPSDPSGAVVQAYFR
jgi:hypothetical protein